MSGRNPPEPTWVSRVEDALRAADDFLPLGELMQLTGASYNRATAALHHLRRCHAADSVESGGRLYWFATPHTDTRARHVELRRPEDPGTRRPRGARRKS